MKLKVTKINKEKYYVKFFKKQIIYLYIINKTF